MKIQWIHGQQHGVIEVVENAAGQAAIDFGQAVRWVETAFVEPEQPQAAPEQQAAAPEQAAPFQEQQAAAPQG